MIEETNSTNLECGGATDSQLVWFDAFSYWTEGIVQLGLGKKNFRTNKMKSKLCKI